MGYALVTPPAAEPVSLAEAKRQCKVDDSADDGLLIGLIVAARELVEMITGRSLITQTWRGEFTSFPCASAPLRLMHGPVQSVSSVAYFDLQGTDTALDAALWKVDLTEQIVKIWPAPDQVWPAAQTQPGAVRVEYVAGFGTAPENVPQSIRQAMLLLIEQWFDNRSALAADPSNASEVPFAVTALLTGHTIQSLA